MQRQAWVLIQVLFRLSRRESGCVILSSGERRGWDEMSPQVLLPPSIWFLLTHSKEVAASSSLGHWSELEFAGQWDLGPTLAFKVCRLCM